MLAADAVAMPMITAHADPSPGVIQTSGRAVDFIEARAGGTGAAALPRVRLVGYTGGEMRVPGYPTPIVLDMQGGVYSQRVPLLKDHSPAMVLGHSESVRIESGRELVVEGVISGANQVAREVVDTAKNGFVWQASIGADPISTERVEAGESATVNGQTFQGPLLVVRRWRMREMTLTAMGADEHTTVSIAAHSAHGDTTMTFAQFLKRLGVTENTDNAAEVAQLRAMYEAQIAASAAAPAPGSAAAPAPGSDPAPAPVANPAPAPGNAPGSAPAPVQAAAGGVDTAALLTQARQLLTQEHTRIAGIQAMSGRYTGAQDSTIIAEAIRDGWSLDRTELALLRAERPTRSAPSDNNSPQTAQVIEAALLRNGGLSEEQLGRHYSEGVVNEAIAATFNGFSLHGLIYAMLDRAGSPRPMGGVQDSTIHEAFRINAQMIQASSAFSTLSLTGILSNVANKALLAAYASNESVATVICKRGTVKDFKEHSRFRLGGMGRLKQLAPSGEIEHTTLAEQVFNVAADTQAIMLTLTRKMWINDDLGAFLDLPQILGRMAWMSREIDVFTLLLSNPGSFFAAGNRNYIEGADTALSVDGLTLAEAKFSDQVGIDGFPIANQAKYLLVPTGLKVPAQQLHKDLVVNETTTANKPKPNSNPHTGKFMPLSSPFLNAQGLPGSSAAAWYLFGDPNVVPAMEIAYLNGKDKPMIDSAETSFNTLGVQMRCVFDYGVAMQDHRGAVKSKGEN